MKRFNPIPNGAEPVAPPKLSKQRRRARGPRPVTMDATEALRRAEHGDSMANYAPIIEGFAARGIPVEDIKPRENVLTFRAWLAKGRCVRKGEHGVKVCTWIPVKSPLPGAQDECEQPSVRTRPLPATVFHVSQTEAAGSARVPRAVPSVAPGIPAAPSTRPASARPEGAALPPTVTVLPAPVSPQPPVETTNIIPMPTAPRSVPAWKQRLSVSRL